MPEKSQQLLRDGREALDRGDYLAARALAQRAVRHAETTRNDEALARALSFTAHCERMVSRFRSALTASSRAIQLFQQVGDPAGEAWALATHSYVASSLYRISESVETAMLSTLIADEVGDPGLTVFSRTYLGYARCWAHDFDAAVDTLQGAVEIALAADPTGALAVQPQVTLASVESTRIVADRNLGRSGRAPDALVDAVEACDRAVERTGLASLDRGMIPTLRSLHQVFRSVSCSWTGRLADAEQSLIDALWWADRYGHPTWLHALHHWCRMELALARGDLALAEAAARETIAGAMAVEHEALNVHVRRALVWLLETQGRLPEAVQEARRLRSIEDDLQVAGLSGRPEVVAWQLSLRRSRREISSLAVEARSLERLSHEDALTGIANRRYLERQLPALLPRNRPGGRSLFIAWIDVDRFKQVNDRYSHAVGDQVLCVVAQAMRRVTRSCDIVCRWAGDEFVVALPDIDWAAAEAVCHRVAMAIAEHDFDNLAPGLQVSVSVGLAKATPDDDVASLLHRGDMSMYQVKRSSAASADDEDAGTWHPSAQVWVTTDQAPLND